MAVVWEQWDGSPFDLNNREIAVRDAEQLVTRVRTGFLNGAIADAQARAVLLRGDLDPARIERYIATWSIARSASTRAPRAAPLGRRSAAQIQAANFPSVLPPLPENQPRPAPAPQPPAPAPQPQAVQPQDQVSEIVAMAPPPVDRVLENPPFGGGDR